MEMERIKEAVEISKELYDIRSKDCGNIPPYALSEEAKALHILIDLATSILQSEMPKKKEIPSDKDICLASPDENYAIGYNSAIDDCTLYLARKEMEHSDKCETMAIDRVEKLAPFLVKVVMEKYGGLIDIGSDLTDLAQAILDYLGKGE